MVSAPSSPTCLFGVSSRHRTWAISSAPGVSPARGSQRAPVRACLRATLPCVNRRNMTVSPLGEDLPRVRILAARQGTSVSRLLAGMLKDLLEQETVTHALAKERNLAMLAQGRDLGTNSHIGWIRDELPGR